MKEWTDSELDMIIDFNLSILLKNRVVETEITIDELEKKRKELQKEIKQTTNRIKKLKIHLVELQNLHNSASVELNEKIK